MVTFNLLNVVVLIVVAYAIWGILPRELTEEMGAIVGLCIEVIWLFVWIIIFPVMGHNIIFV